MPFYDLLCNTCGKENNIRASIAEKTTGQIPCPDCGSFDLETVFKRAPFSITKSETGCPNRHVCNSSCCHANE